MKDRSSPRLVEDSRGREKIKISLPGGRYQLSLDDRGVNLLHDRLGYQIRDTVPDLVVKILVATGDAWFPNQKDYENIIAVIADTKPITEEDLSKLAGFLQSTRVSEARIAKVRDVVKNSALSDYLDPDTIEVNELPDVPDSLLNDSTPDFVEETTESEPGPTDQDPTEQLTAPETGPDSVEEIAAELAAETGMDEGLLAKNGRKLAERSVSLPEVRETLERQFGDKGPEPDIFDIPGIGTVRGHKLMAEGLDSVDQLADARPVDIVESSSVDDEELATTIVEGARELIGNDEPTAKQLARQTSEPEGDFKAALAQLAAAGVPPSAAAPTLREVFGPSIIDVRGVDGIMAYFLHDAGYTTPWELTQATPEELEEVDYLGPSTAEKVITNAEELVQK